MGGRLWALGLGLGAGAGLGFDFGLNFDFDAGFVLGFDFAFDLLPVALGIVLRRLPTERAAAPRAMHGARLGNHVVKRSAASTLAFESIVSADDAVIVIGIVCPKAAADGAAFSDSG